jgi:hypothetical protein
MAGCLKHINVAGRAQDPLNHLQAEAFRPCHDIFDTDAPAPHWKRILLLQSEFLFVREQVQVNFVAGEQKQIL